MTALYTANATVTGGREGRGETDDKRLSVQLSRPGAAGEGTNPEQLFAVGYAACFGGAVGYIAGQKKLEVGAVTINSSVVLNKDDGGFSISAILDVLLPKLEQAAAEDLVREAHQFCPYSKATRNNITVQLKANGKII